VTQRNAHSSTIDALIMSGLRPTFVSPELDPELHIAHCMTPEALDRALGERPGAVGATVVSPTYFGAVADVAGLAEVAHARGVPLIVDEAWGAHLAFHDDLPTHALALGADLVVSSIHKVVGSLTQSAMVHLGHGTLIDEDVVDRCVTVLESTSPSRSTPPAALRPSKARRC
jgi:lysine decarboxylase